MKSAFWAIVLACVLTFFGCSMIYNGYNEDNASTIVENVAEEVIINPEVQKRNLSTNNLTPDSSIVNESGTSNYYEVLAEDKHFKILGNHELRRYPYFIYDSNGFVVESGEERRLSPSIEYISNEILEICSHAGPGSNFCKYYHIGSDKLSIDFENPFLVKEERIVYYNRSKLIVQNLFDPDIFYWEYPIEMYMTTGGGVPTEFLDNGTKLKITHQRPSDDEEETLVFDLD